MVDRKPVLGPEFRPRVEGIQRPLSREPKAKSKWRHRRPVELIVGPFYRAADLARRPTKRQAFLSLLAVVVLGFLLTATWSLAGRLDAGHDPRWSHEASGAVGPVALSPDGRVLVAAVTSGAASQLHAFRAAGGPGNPFARIAFNGLVTHLLVDDAGTGALVAVSSEDLGAPGVVGPGEDERGGPALYLVDLRAGSIVRADELPLPVRALAASGDLSVVGLAFPNFDDATIAIDGATVFEHTFQEPPTAVAVSSDGRFAAFGSRAGDLAVHDRAGPVTHEGSQPSHEVTSLALSSDGMRLVAGFGAFAASGDAARRGGSSASSSAIATEAGRVQFFDEYGPELDAAWERTTDQPIIQVDIDGKGEFALARTTGGEPLLLGVPASGAGGWSVTLASTVERALLSDDGSTVGLAYTFRGVETRRATTGSLLWNYDQDRNESRIEATTLALSADGSVIASNGRRAGRCSR
jgi:hypothetical protein